MPITSSMLTVTLLYLKKLWKECVKPVVDQANFIASFAESYVATASDMFIAYCSALLSTASVISSILEAARKAAASTAIS